MGLLKRVYLMRGLPSCGKSYSARRLAGPDGIILETDAFFFSHVGEDPTSYDYDPSLVPAAQRWNLGRYLEALKAQRTPIVVDRGNGLSLTSQTYARHAVEFGYLVELKEPTSPWWVEVRGLLKDPEANHHTLRSWAKRLAQMNLASHRTTSGEIYERMMHWRIDLTVEDILGYGPD